jgi:hypothetical protein
MSNHLTTQQLIQKIETADRRYRKSSTVLLIIIGLAIALMLFLQSQALEAFKTQSADRGAAIKLLQEENKREAETTNRYLQCIASYFANPDRANTVIQSIDDCNIDPSTGAFVPGIDQSPLASSSSEGTPGNLSPGPSGGPSTTPGITTPDPDTETDPNPAPPRGVIPLIVDGVSGLVDRARGILGL